MTNNIEGIIHNAFNHATGKRTSQSELDSWKNSLQYMDRVLNDPVIADNVTIAIEYHIPRSSKRIDFIVAGQDHDHKDSVVLIELKQWQSASSTNKDGIVVTRFKHGEKETAHPSYQVWSYKCLLEDYNLTIQEEEIQLHPCAYLHNYQEDGVIDSQFYSQYIDQAPLFLEDDALKLRAFIKDHIVYDDINQVKNSC